MRAPLALALLLAGCGGGGVKSDDVRDPVAQNVVAAAAEGTPAKVAAAVDCGNRPEFVPVYAGGQVTTCVSGADGMGAAGRQHVSGTIVYLTDADPAQVLGWSRAQANAAGLAQRLSTPTSYSAGENSKRSVMILVEPHQGRTRVTVNWGSGV